MAAQVEIEEQESLTNLDNGEIFDSEIAGNITGASPTVLLREGGLEHDVIKNCFISGMGPFAIDTRIVTVRKNSVESFTKKARFAAFRVFTEAMARKNGGNANVKYGWYSGSKEEIDRIVSYGFSNRESENGSHGVGIHLIHHRYSLAAAVVGEADDEQGLKHILLCRLILGKPELIVSGSKQSCPSSNQFDSGVDNLENPRKYVIWSSTMNSYILPCYVVSFTSPRIRGLTRSGGGGGLGRARSPCVSLIVLMSILTKSLDPSRMNMILTAYDAFRKRKLRREQLIRKMREVVGDYLLLEIINNHKDKV